MLLVRNLLIALICAAPLMLLSDSLIVQGLVAGVGAVAVAISCVTLRSGEAGFFISIARPLLLAAAIPALWMLLQILPLGILVHPIWSSAQAALHHRINGRISIDPALSLIALGQYLSLTAIAFLTGAIAVDRQRAERILFALTIAVGIASFIVIVHQLLLPGAWLAEGARTAAIDCASLGTIIAGAACIRALNRHERAARLQSELTEPLTIINCSISLLICAAAVALGATRELLFATGCGLLALAYQLIIRRLGFGLLGTAVLAAPAIWIAVVLVATRPVPHDVSLLLAFAGESAPRSIALSQRMLDDTPVVGTGAGTFTALAPIYREVDDPPADFPAPTTAVAIAIEYGKPMLWLIVAATAALIILLLHASLQRGRDSLYSAIAGSCLLTLLLICFTNAGFFKTTPALLIAVTIGLGLAQSKSRKATQP